MQRLDRYFGAARWHAVDEARWRTLRGCVQDSRPPIVEHWRTAGTWLRAPILVAGEVMGSPVGSECLVGFTRLGNKGDVKATIRTFGRVSGPIALVGHPYGGTVITHAGVDPRVAALVYIAALGPDETETSQGQQDKFPKMDVWKGAEVADGRVWMRPEGVAYFAGDLSPEEQGVVYATHFPPALDLFHQKHEGIAWRSKPSWSIVADGRFVEP